VSKKNLEYEGSMLASNESSVTNYVLFAFLMLMIVFFIYC